VWLYFRCGWNSAEIAEELGMNPPAVRQWLARVREVAQKAGSAPPDAIQQ
jgi:DNA-directed RNA polymerase specialized sigma24 family protein